MKIVEAIWEIRNLGKKTIEIELELSDSIECIRKYITEHHYDYYVIKLPVNRFDLIHPIQNLGFKYSEILNYCSINIKALPKLSDLESRILQKLTYRLMNFDDEKDNLFSKINEKIFISDRIAIDPVFGLDCSSKRYIGLINDDVNNGSKLFELFYNQVPVGFFILNIKDDISYSNLAGIYKNYQNKGFGLYLNYFQLLESSKNEVNYLRTAFSSNNIGALSIHKRLGFNIYKTVSIFTKHHISDIN
jgi:hypothetical protein